jgi:hypothetical protein
MTRPVRISLTTGEFNALWRLTKPVTDATLSQSVKDLRVALRDATDIGNGRHELDAPPEMLDTIEAVFRESLADGHLTRRYFNRLMRTYGSPRARTVREHVQPEPRPQPQPRSEPIRHVRLGTSSRRRPR